VAAGPPSHEASVTSAAAAPAARGPSKPAAMPPVIAAAPDNACLRDNMVYATVFRSR
jgi:hypothetical protein